jgi:hypothetical protein
VLLTELEVCAPVTFPRSFGDALAAAGGRLATLSLGLVIHTSNASEACAAAAAGLNACTALRSLKLVLAAGAAADDVVAAIVTALGGMRLLRALGIYFRELPDGATVDEHRSIWSRAAKAPELKLHNGRTLLAMLPHFAANQALEEITVRGAHIPAWQASVVLDHLRSLPRLWWFEGVLDAQWAALRRGRDLGRWSMRNSSCSF